MNIDVAVLPSHLPSPAGRCVVVFDVLRATTSMVAALAAGVAEIRIFGDLESARAAAAVHPGPKLLCGEQRCLRPEGFDLGNSPAAFNREAHAGRVAFMATTNGTRAILAAAAVNTVLIGALVNAGAVAGELARRDQDAVLLCAGTDGQVTLEDLLGCGAVLDELSQRAQVALASDTARLALRLWRATQHDVVAALSDAQGGRNVIAAGLADDIAFAAAVNSVPLVGAVQRDPLRVAGLG